MDTPFILSIHTAPDCTVFPTNSYPEALTPNVITMEDN